MTLYITNSFNFILEASGSMCVSVDAKRISIDEAKSIIKEWKDDIKSIVWHQATAEILSILLGMKIEVNRAEIKLDPRKDAMIVFQWRRQIGAADYDLYYVNPTPCQ
jgi:hypothetical protein